MGRFKKEYINLHYSLFFNGLFDIFFNTYFAFLFAAMILINTEYFDKNYHFKLIAFSWAMILVCTVLMPAIILYSALVPDKKRQSRQF